MPHIDIIYRRLPDQITHYKHQLLYEKDSFIVTGASFSPSKSLIAEVRELQDLNYQAVWFVFDGKWYDLGKIYRPSGKVEGYYSDIIRPMERTNQGLKIEDLFLDLWISPDGRYQILDRDEFEEAVKLGWVDPKTADRAQEELEKLIQRVKQRRFPPPLADRF